MRKVIRKAVAGALCSTLVVTSSGVMALAKEPAKVIVTEPKKSAVVEKEVTEVTAKNVLYVTAEMVNAKGILEIKEGNWDRIVISRDVNAKKVVLNGITTKEVVIESGTDCVFEMKNSVVDSVEVVAPELEVIDLAKIKELIASGMSASEVAKLHRNYLKEQSAVTNLQPKIVVQKGTEINTVKISSNAQFDFKSDKVEKVEITLTSNQERFNIGLNGFAGAVSVAENKDKKDNTKSFLNLDLKNSEVKELVLNGSEKSAYTINSQGKSKVENLEVKGSSNISLGVVTEAIKVAKDAVNAALKIYSEVKNVVVEGSKNKITLADSAKVEYAEIKGDDTQIHGSGNLGSADITGNGANVSIPGANVSGDNNSTPPATEDNTPSRPSVPSTPSNPTGTPSNPTGTPIPTPTDKPVEVVEGDFGYYKNTDGTVTISSFLNEDATIVTIPETIKGMKVTKIGDSAFAWLEKLKEVTIPNTVTELGYDAFWECYALEKIVLPEGLKKIGSYAFGYCRKLTEITIPESVVEIGYNAFDYCESLKELHIPKNVVTFGEYSLVNESDYFSSMWGLTSLEKVTVAAENQLFTAKEGILYSKNEEVLLYVPDGYVGEVTIPTTVKEIEAMAFVNCHQMTKLFIPKTFEGDDYAFDYAEGLTSLKEFVVEEGNPCYYSEAGLLYIAYESNSNLIKVPALAIPAEYTLPSKLANGTPLYAIHSDAFIDCDHLTSVTLSETIEDISEMQCFRNCNALTEIKVVAENPAFTSIDGVLFSKDKKTLVAFPIAYAETSYAVAEGVETIGSAAFYNCYRKLESVDLPSTLKNIEQYAFYDCAKLTKMIIPDGITELGADAFSYCSNLVSVQLPKNLEVIGYGAFRGCGKLQTIDIPATVVEIGNYAFSSCDALTEVVLPEGITRVANDLFYSCDNLVKVTIPESVVEIGSYAFGSCRKLAEIKLPEGVTKIGSSAFSSCIGLTELIIPKGVTVIESNTFSRCTGLTEMVIPDSVKEIKYNAFYGCKALEKIVISGSVKKMGDKIFDGAEKVVIYTPEGSVADEYAKKYDIKTEYIADTYVPTIEDFIKWQGIGFDGLSGVAINEFLNKEVTKIEIPKTIEGRTVLSISERAFANMTKLETIILPNTIQHMNRYAFAGCSSLTTIVLPEDLQWINPNAFEGCSSLKKVEIPSSVTLIAEYVFKDCTSLEEIWIPSVNTALNPNVFAGCSKDLVIWTVAGSKAEQYADSNKITVKYIGEEDDEPSTPELPTHNMVEFEFDSDNNLMIKKPSEIIMSFLNIDIKKDMVEGYTVVGIKDEAFKGCTVASGAAITIGKDITIGKEAFANLQVQVASGAAITIKLEDGVTFDETSFANSVTRIIFDVSETIRKELEAILEENDWNWDFK